jgi:hypothetical protein
MRTLDRNELTNASPTRPTPGGSSRPRAKTTSAPGQAADADGAGAITNAAATDAAAANPARRFAGCDLLPNLNGFTDVVSEPR